MLNRENYFDSDMSRECILLIQIRVLLFLINTISMKATFLTREQCIGIGSPNLNKCCYTEQTNLSNQQISQVIRIATSEKNAVTPMTVKSGRGF